MGMTFTCRRVLFCRTWPSSAIVVHFLFYSLYDAHFLMTHSTLSRTEVYWDAKLYILFDPDFMWPGRPEGNASNCQKSSSLGYAVTTDFCVCVYIFFFCTGQFFTRKNLLFGKFSVQLAVYDSDLESSNPVCTHEAQGWRPLPGREEAKWTEIKVLLVRSSHTRGSKSLWRLDGSVIFLTLSLRDVGKD